PRHDLTLATMPLLEIETVVHTWVGQYRELGGPEEINHVQIFENRGAMMGASNPHPHCQIWATASIPEEPAKELAAQTGYWKTHHRWRETPGMALSRALLSTALALGDDPQIYGWIRNAGNATTRHCSRERCRAFTRISRD